MLIGWVAVGGGYLYLCPWPLSFEVYKLDIGGLLAWGCVCVCKDLAIAGHESIFWE